jgi:3-oxoadipate enol-lactonase
MRMAIFNRHNNEALVILSGYMFGCWAFEPMIKYLTEERLLVIDNIGARNEILVGRSVDEVINEIAVNLIALNVNQFHLAGHSMGGFVAQEFARRHPERLKSVILMGSCSINEFRNSHRTKALPVIDALFDLDEESFFRLTTHGIFTAKFLNDSTDLVYLRQQFDSHLPSRESCRDQLYMLEEMYAFDSECLPIDLPCLAVYGSEDTIVPEEWVLRLSEHFAPHPQFKSLQGGHMFMYEQPEECAMLLKQWLMEFVN